MGHEDILKNCHDNHQYIITRSPCDLMKNVPTHPWGGYIWILKFNKNVLKRYFENLAMTNSDDSINKKQMVFILILRNVKKQKFDVN